MTRKVVIDCLPESAKLYRRGYAVVAVDVIRATTSIVTVVSMGRRCFPVASLEAAQALSFRLSNPLLAGEISGGMPDGFHMNNSPAELALRTDVGRPLILLSSSGTRLIDEARGSDAVYIGSFRNATCLVNHLAGCYERVAVIGAGSQGEFREEDQMCCAWIAQGLIGSGFRPEGKKTVEVIRDWRGKRPGVIVEGKSADYLRRSGQVWDLEFVLAHIDDLDAVFLLQGEEVVMLVPKPDAAAVCRPSTSPAGSRQELHVEY